MGLQDRGGNLDPTNWNTAGPKVCMPKSFHNMFVVLVWCQLILSYHQVKQWKPTQVCEQGEPGESGMHSVNAMSAFPHLDSPLEARQFTLPLVSWFFWLQALHIRWRRSVCLFASSHLHVALIRKGHAINSQWFLMRAPIAVTVAYHSWLRLCWSSLPFVLDIPPYQNALSSLPSHQI